MRSEAGIVQRSVIVLPLHSQLYPCYRRIESKMLVPHIIQFPQRQVILFDLGVNIKVPAHEQNKREYDEPVCLDTHFGKNNANAYFLDLLILAYVVVGL